METLTQLDMVGSDFGTSVSGTVRVAFGDETERHTAVVEVSHDEVAQVVSFQ